MRKLENTTARATNSHVGKVDFAPGSLKFWNITDRWCYATTDAKGNRKVVAQFGKTKIFLKGR